MAATKTVPAEVINDATQRLGVNLIGENRAQELNEKYDALIKDHVEIHFIGALQTNKVKSIIGKVSMIHSLDSVRLAKAIDSACVQAGRTVDVLIEINIAKEQAKSGIAAGDLFAFYEEIKSYSALQVRGLMTMGPAGADENEYRRYFSQVKALYDSFVKEKIPHVQAPVLSMGMSESYQIALACGSNLVRIGSGLFGKRNYGGKQQSTIK